MRSSNADRGLGIEDRPRAFIRMGEKSMRIAQSADLHLYMASRAGNRLSKGIFVFFVAMGSMLFASGNALAQSGSAGFGIQWVRSHPFTTWAWSFGNNTLAQYEGENFSNYFTNSLGGGNYQTPWIALSDISESLTTIDTRLMQPYITINYIDDEPSNSQLPTIASNAAQTRTIRPDLPVLVNALGGTVNSSYTQY